MTVQTYGRWPWLAAASVLPAWAAVARRRHALARDGRWVAGLALPILLSHQTEEWVRPGNFLPFANQQLLGSAAPDWPLTPRLALHVNVSIGWVSALAGAALWRRTPAPAVAVLWLEAGNVAMHTGMAVRQRRYNPGVATAALLMAPHAAAGARWMRRSDRHLSSPERLVTFAAGASILALPVAMKIRLHRGRGTVVRAPAAGALSR